VIKVPDSSPSERALGRLAIPRAPDSCMRLPRPRGLDGVRGEGIDHPVPARWTARRHAKAHHAKLDGPRRTRPDHPPLPFRRPGRRRARLGRPAAAHPLRERQCGLRAQKILLAEGGIIASERTRAPLGPVSPRTRRGLIELAAARDLLVMRWAR